MTSEQGPLATGPLSMQLLAFERVPEERPPTDHELTYVLLVVRSRRRILLVHERERGLWELPGGRIDPGETPRQAAVRELSEETGQRVAPEALRFSGFAKTELPRRDIRYGAVYTAELTEDAVLPFEPNEEISAIHWWDGNETLPGRVQTVDVFLAELTDD